MKNALLLHGTGGNSQSNWLGWLRKQLETNEWKVWSPDLPQADRPSIERYNQFILANKKWKFNDKTILVGHSSGAVAILGLLQALPLQVQVEHCFLIGSFKGDLGWEVLQDLFPHPFDFQLIKTKAKRFTFIHSDDDPYCPLDGARLLSTKLDGELVIVPGQKHFSVGTAGEQYKQFPFLKNLILHRNMKISFLPEFFSWLKKLKIEVWLDGGWAVDALLGKQTREHDDIDIVIEKNDAQKLRHFLEKRGFVEVIRSDSRAWNYVMISPQADRIDFHLIEFDSEGNGIYGPKENGDLYTKEALLGRGEIAGQKVRCIAPQQLLEYHTGYQLREKDKHDIKLLCDKFGLENI